MQTIIVGLIVLASLAFIARRALGTWRASRAAASGCGSSCGCSSSAPVAKHP